MVTYVQALTLGLLQGFSELFPVSSLGHTALLPAMLGWHLDRSTDAFLAFVVLTHFATALVLLGFFWRDWVAIIGGIFRTLAARRIAPGDTYGRLGWLLVVSTVPAGLIGLALQHKIEHLFADTSLIAIVLLLNGVVLYGVEVLRDRRVAEGPHDDSKIAALSWTEALIVGLAQCFALIPGFSRTGLTMTGGLAAGLSHENSVRYSFLLATPIISAAAALKIPVLFHHGGAGLGPAAVGGIAAAATAYFSVRFLLKYFETRTLTPIAIYCMAAGVGAFMVVTL
ncbi:undecaprenyl-diphosphate phosphatase [Solirhodobacter olei]|uniref:undecaprenyl-diphosphate phosphatase n=1 Tax=Solirhodobacter olei TaxID=2493082 RepID=UPI000FD9653D|nr:undecaprenyl-diphosphate phosphatase [Solirhodobacter olei]